MKYALKPQSTRDGLAEEYAAFEAQMNEQIEKAKAEAERLAAIADNAYSLRAETLESEQAQRARDLYEETNGIAKKDSESAVEEKSSYEGRTGLAESMADAEAMKNE